MEEEEGLLLSSHTEELSSSSKESYSLLSEIANASTMAFVLAFIVGSSGALAFGCYIGYSAPTQSSIMNELNLSIADASSLSVYSGLLWFILLILYIREEEVNSSVKRKASKLNEIVDQNEALKPMEPIVKPATTTVKKVSTQQKHDKNYAKTTANVIPLENRFGVIADLDE